MEHDETASLQVRADIFKALGHPVRLKIVEFLMASPRCVAEIAEDVGGSLSIVSQHLAILRQSGIIVDERKSRKIYYALATPQVAEFCTYLTHSLAPTLCQTSAERRKSKLVKCVSRVVGLASVVISAGLFFCSSYFCNTPSSVQELQTEASSQPTFEDVSVWECDYASLRLCKDPLGTGLECGSEMWHVLGAMLEQCEREAQISAL
jgi:ArsR family transcriptional regulator